MRTQNVIWYDTKRQKILSSNNTGEEVFDALDTRRLKIVKIALLQNFQNLGIIIRGGKDLNIGFYISNVIMGSLADNEGLKIGDQILNVNGHDFSNLYHHRAIQILRAYHQYIFVLREIGLVPMYKELKVLKKGVNRKDQINNFDPLVYDTSETTLSFQNGIKVVPKGINQDNAKFKRKYGKLEDILWPTKQSSCDEIYDDISLASGYLNNNEDLYGANLVNGGNVFDRKEPGTVELSPSISHDNSTVRLSPVPQLRQNNMVVGNALKRSVGIEYDLNRLTESPCYASGFEDYERSEIGGVGELRPNQVYRDSLLHEKPPRIGSEDFGKRLKNDDFKNKNLKTSSKADGKKIFEKCHYDKDGKNEAIDQQKIKLMSKSPAPVGAFYTCGCSPTRIFRSAPNTGLQHYKWVSEPSLTALNNDSLLVGHASRYTPMDKLGANYAYDGIPRRVHAKTMLYNSRVEMSGAKHLTLSCPDLGALASCHSRGKYGPMAAKIYDRTWWLGSCKTENTVRNFDKSFDVGREKAGLGYFNTCGLEYSSSQCRYSKRLGKVNALIQEFETKRNAQTTVEQESKEHKEIKDDLKDTERASILFKKNKESLEHLKLRLDQICKERELVLSQTSEDSPKKFSGRIYNKGEKDLASPNTDEHIYENAEVIRNYFKGQREKSTVLNEEKVIKSKRNNAYHQKGNNNLVAINLDENVVIQV